MNTSKEYTGVASAASDFFEKHPDGRAFLLEWKSLTDSDKKEIQEGLEKLGYKIKVVNPKN